MQFKGMCCPERLYLWLTFILFALAQISWCSKEKWLCSSIFNPYAKGFPFRWQQLSWLWQIWKSLAPSDPISAWMEGHQETIRTVCQTGKSKQKQKSRGRHWQTYLQCFQVNNMDASVKLRGVKLTQRRLHSRGYFSQLSTFPKALTK